MKFSEAWSIYNNYLIIKMFDDPSPLVVITLAIIFVLFFLFEWLGFWPFLLIIFVIGVIIWKVIDRYIDKFDESLAIVRAKEKEKKEGNAE